MFHPFLFIALAASIPCPAADPPLPSALESLLPDAPRGRIVEMPPWKSKIYPGTVRKWSIYVPAQYREDEPAALMIFQDGSSFRNRRGSWRVASVLDRLIAEGAMPPAIAVMLDPGSDAEKGLPAGPWKATNRSIEYDAVGDRFARFLLGEILPEVEKKFRISSDPAQRAIAGAGNGGTCAFTVAWERPDAFGKVLCLSGRFMNIGGANAYPSLIRKTERKPLRVFLNFSGQEVDDYAGNARIGVEQMHAALRYMGCDCRCETGEQDAATPAGAAFPDALRWLWRKDSAAPKIDTKGDLGGDMTLHRLLIDGEGWQPVATDLGFADGPCPDGKDGVLVSDLKAGKIFQFTADGRRAEFLAEGVSGLKWAPDGKLYGCQGAKKRIVAIDPASKNVEPIATDVEPNDLAITKRGQLYFTDTGKKQVVLVDLSTREKRVVDEGIGAPNGITLSPDQGTLAVSDYRGRNVWAFRIEEDGALSARAPCMTMRCALNPEAEFIQGRPAVELEASGGDGMTTDTAGRYYVATALGVQVFDPTGRACGLLAMPPGDGPLTSCALAGPDGAYLYVTKGGAVFRRRVQAAAVR